MPKLLVILSNRGYYWSELALPYEIWSRAGVTMDFASPEGGIPMVDPTSVQIRPILSGVGLGVDARHGPDTEFGRELNSRLTATLPLAKVKGADYDAVYFVGGHGAMFDLNRNPEAHRVAAECATAGRVVAAVCHATSVLAGVQVKGKSILEGLRYTGFSDLMEGLLPVAGMVDKQFLPIPFSNEQEMRKAAGPGGHYVGGIGLPTVVEDGQVVTGEGPTAAPGVARVVLTKLSKAAT